MLHDTVLLEAALAPLVGRPLWKSHRAADMLVFHFGDHRTQTTRTGQEVEVGELALHVQCAWRIRGAEGIVVASGDRFVRATTALDGDDWEWSAPGANRCDERLRAWLAQPHAVTRVTADALGGFALSFADGFELEVFPDDSDSERWRILRPGDPSSHVVVCGNEIEDATAPPGAAS